jgi:Protein of unknown function (DUF2688)
MKIRLETRPCERCGKPLVVANNSFYGLDKEKRSFGVICEDCATEQERHEVNMAIGNWPLPKPQEANNMQPAKPQLKLVPKTPAVPATVLVKVWTPLHKEIRLGAK